MASTPEGSAGDKRGRRKRPGPATIDLTATEMPESAAAGRESPAPSDTAAPAAPAAEAARPSEHEPPAAPGSASAAWVAAPEAPASVTRIESSATGEPVPPRNGDAEPTVDRAGPGESASEAPPAEPAVADAAATDRASTPAGLPPAATGRRRWPLWTAIAAALLLAAAGLWLGATRDDPGLAQRLGRIEAQLAQVRAPERAPASELATRLAAAEDAVRRLGDLATRLDAAEQALKTREGRSPAEPPALDRVEARLDKLESAAAPRAETDPAVGARIAAAEAATKTLGDRLAAAEAATRSLAERMAATGATATAINDRLAAMEAGLRALSERGAELGKRVDAVAGVASAAERQAVLVSEQEARRPDERTVRLALVAGALRDTVARGDPFAPELAAARPLVSDPAPLARLEPFAATGVPSEAALARELSGLVPALVSRAQPAPREGVLERLQASAERLVRIRRIDAGPGDDASAGLARLEASVAQGKADAALAELLKLPPDIRAPAAAWIGRAQARNAALEAANRLAREATADLAKN